MNPVLTVFIASVCMFACERLWGPRKWPQVRHWWLRAVLVNSVQVCSVFLFGYYLDGRILSLPHLFAGHELGTPLAVLLSYLTITFIFYWWHRARHASRILWRVFHQFHHSPQRLEIITSFYKHPLEIVINSLMTSLICYVLLGITPEQAAITTLIMGVAELYYHWNVATPFWTGYIFQRPESHCVHHQKNLHRFNYSDLPLWDMLFGTFRNPRIWNAECGFDHDEELRIAAMLAFHDVNEELSKGRNNNEPVPGIADAR